MLYENGSITGVGSGAVEVDLSNLVLLDACPPHALDDLALGLVAAEAVLLVLLPLAGPLAAVAEAVRALALPHALRELPRVALAGLPLHLRAALQHAPPPRPAHAAPVVEHQDPLAVELVVLEEALVHALLEVELPLAGLGPRCEVALVDGVVLHAVLAEAVRQVVFPRALEGGAVGERELTLPVRGPLGHFALVDGPVGEGEVDLLALRELAEEELAGEGGAVLPGDLPALVRLPVHRPAGVPHSLLDLQSLDAGLDGGERFPHRFCAAGVEVLLRGALAGLLGRVHDDGLPEVEAEREGLVVGLLRGLFLVLALLDVGEVEAFAGQRLFLEDVAHLAVGDRRLALGAFVTHYYSYFYYERAL